MTRRRPLPYLTATSPTSPVYRILYPLLLALAGLAACSRAPRETLRAGFSGPAASTAAQPADSVRRLFDELYLQSVVESLAGRKGVQFELLQAALDLRPDAPEALADIAGLYAEMASAFDKSPQDTVAALMSRAVALAPDNDFYRRTLAGVLYGKGDLAGCIAQMEQIATRRHDDQLQLALTRLYNEKGDLDKALAALDEVDRRNGASEETAMMRFYLHIRRGDNARAYAALENLCAEYPSDLSYRVLLGDAYAQMGYHEMALATYEDVLAAEPDNSAAQISLLGYYRRTGQDSLYLSSVSGLVLNPKVAASVRSEAMTDYVRRALERHTDSLEVDRLFRGTLALPQEDDEMWTLYLGYLGEALEGVPADTITAVARRALADRPECRPARMHCIGRALAQGDYAELARLARAGVEAVPTEIIYRYFEAAALNSLDRGNEAEQAMAEGYALALSDRFPPADATPEEQENALRCASDLAGMYADALHERGAASQAYAVYEKALAWNPDNHVAANNYAYFLSTAGGDLDRALSLSRRTVEAEPDNAVYLDTYAWALYLAGRYEEARYYIGEALDHDTEHAAVYLDHAGDIAYRSGRTAEALAYWRRALKATSDRDGRRALNRKISRKRL